MLPADLNLLRVFDILMEQRSVTRAAQQLGLTQSAVSHALRRLRADVGDPLFVRGPGGLQTTPRAEEIAVGVRSALAQLDMAMSRRPFDPVTTTRTFEISAGSYFCTVLLPDIIRRAREQSPNVSFRISPHGSDLSTALDTGQVDLALGGFGRVADRMRKEALFHEEVVWIAAANSLPDRPDLGVDDLAGRPRLEIATGSRPFDLSGMTVFAGVEQRTRLDPSDDTQPYVTVNDAFSAAALVATSDLIALIPRQIASREAKRWRLRVIRPRDSEQLELSMLFHARSDHDPAHLWLRNLVHRACRLLR
jgi:DNA-binding transcriptional LysR family regulator